MEATSASGPRPTKAKHPFPILPNACTTTTVTIIIHERERERERKREREREEKPPNNNKPLGQFITSKFNCKNCNRGGQEPRGGTTTNQE